jgi:tRNA-2-methylthio-N6-dimethylallyladenosine synthase
MNEYDSEHIAGILTSAGALPGRTAEDSDLILVNTCAVREKSVEKLYSLLGRLSGLKNEKERLIVVAGCVAQLYRGEIFEKRPFVDLVIGPDNYWRLPEMLRSRCAEKALATQWYREWHEIPDIQRRKETSGYITVMEGCDNFCAYCVVPYTRGREKFRPARNILDEAKHMAAQGYLEVQLLGQNVNSYRDPETGMDLSDLLREVDALPGIAWVRFITSHPRNFNARLVHTMYETASICHQLHLPIQAGSDSVLARMNRGYTTSHYLGIISELRKLMPDIALSTDIIVGFPGETEADFQKTLEILERIRFTNIFSFKYSPRPQTAASRWEDSVPLPEKKARLQRVQDMQKSIQSKQNQAQAGRTFQVLCLGKSKKDPGVYSGRNYAHQVINFTARDNFEKRFVEVRITGAGPYSLKGEALD